MDMDMDTIHIPQLTRFIWPQEKKNAIFSVKQFKNIEISSSLIVAIKIYTTKKEENKLKKR